MDKNKNEIVKEESKKNRGVWKAILAFAIIMTIGYGVGFLAITISHLIKG